MDLFYILFFSLLGLALVGQILNSLGFSPRGKTPGLERSFLWILFSLLLGLWLGLIKGAEKAMSFLGVFGIEYLLSLDNLITFHLIFEFSKTATFLRQKILSIGLLSAVLLRLLLIVFGLYATSNWSLIYPLFGLFLFYGAYRLFHPKEEKPPSLLAGTKRTKRGPFIIDPQQKWLFWSNGKIGVGSAALTLLAIESSDIFFALDSVPASFALTDDPLVIIGGNICGILGLRSLYFLVEKMAQKIISIRKLSAWLLLLMGAELIAKFWVEIPPLYSFIALVALCILHELNERRLLKQKGKAAKPAQK